MKPPGLDQLNYFHVIPVLLEKEVNSFIGFITQTHSCIQTHPETQKYRDTHTHTGTDKHAHTIQSQTFSVQAAYFLLHAPSELRVWACRRS